MDITYHQPLSKKPTIGIVALSACALATDDIPRAEQVLLTAGFEVFNYYQHQASCQRFGGTDEARLAQLNDALDNPEIELIMALRGSYGISRLLPLIDFNKIANSGKLLVGYSDFNALQLAMLAKTGTASLCGPMICNDFTRENLSQFTHDHFYQAIAARQHTISFVAENNPTIETAGILWGGNLAMLVHLLGTDYFPQINNGILFLEDIGEHPYRVERMLLQLHYAGVLEKQNAIVLGSFSGYKLAEHDHGYDFEAMLTYIRGVVNTPILTGLPFGHIEHKASLMQGAQTSLSCIGDQTRLLMQY